MDFTLEKYSSLISALQRAGYTFITYADFATGVSLIPKHACAYPAGAPAQVPATAPTPSPADGALETSTAPAAPAAAAPETVTTMSSAPAVTTPPTSAPATDTAPAAPQKTARVIVLRHDVDLHPERALKMAMVEAGLGVRATYYFRAVPESWDEEAICAISSLGHEVGYHYESLTTCGGDVDAAFEDFCTNLTRLCELVPVHTVCMHGSPRSPWDSKDIWKKYDYRELGVVAEPYLDTDWQSTFYLTDTGRRWDGFKVSLRDRIPQMQDEWTARGLVFHSTDDLLRACNRAGLPPRIMITTHPQRWTPFGFGWLTELVMQNIKNIVKGIKISRKVVCEK